MLLGHRPDSDAPAPLCGGRSLDTSPHDPFRINSLMVLSKRSAVRRMSPRVTFMGPPSRESGVLLLLPPYPPDHAWGASSFFLLDPLLGPPFCGIVFLSGGTVPQEVVFHALFSSDASLGCSRATRVSEYSLPSSANNFHALFLLIHLPLLVAPKERSRATEATRYNLPVATQLWLRGFFCVAPCRRGGSVAHSSSWGRAGLA